MRKRVVVIDNYDSFTYNLVQYVETLGAECIVWLNDRTSVDLVQYLESLSARCEVHLNDRVDVATVATSKPDGILLSPGPGTPDDAGVTLEIISQLKGRFPMLGVCLGHQSIGQAFGGTVVVAERLMHGKTSMIEHDGQSIYRDLPSPFQATRYHSLILRPEDLPACLTVTARTSAGEIMGVRHQELDVEGVQFHPESILTDVGMKMMKNWLETL